MSICRRRRWSIRSVVLSLAACVAACSAAPTSPSEQAPTPLTLSLRSDAWQTVATPDPYPLFNSDEADLVFEFPTNGSMHYLFTSSTRQNIRGTLVVSLRVTTTGPALFNSLEPLTSACAIPPSVRPFFWSNDNGSGSYDRWWSNPQSYPLANGTASIAVPLLPEHWSSVNGRYGSSDAETRYGFAKAVLNVTRLGLTFGGGCSFGHGINILSGGAEFRLTDYAIR